MTAAVIVFFWILSMTFAFWVGLKTGQGLHQKYYDDWEV